MGVVNDTLLTCFSRLNAVPITQVPELLMMISKFLNSTISSAKYIIVIDAYCSQLFLTSSKP